MFAFAPRVLLRDLPCHVKFEFAFLQYRGIAWWCVESIMSSDAWSLVAMSEGIGMC